MVVLRIFFIVVIKDNILHTDTDTILKNLEHPINDVRIISNHLKKKHLKIKDSSVGCKLELHFCEVRKVTIGKGCSLCLDLRDNPYIQTVIVKDNFSGNIYLSRSSVKKIVIGNNCRCNISLNDSINCFRLRAGDVFSGKVEISNSCFHKFQVGYYCYAEINLEQNWGKKHIFIGDSFRGILNINAVKTPLIKIGDDCKGEIKISSAKEQNGSEKLNIADDFAGSLDLSGDCNMKRIEVGDNASGILNLLRCQALKIVKFEKKFSGVVDLSESAIEYLRAQNGCCGKIVILNCPHLTLLKLPLDKRGDVASERNPLKIEIDSHHIYYHFQFRRLPSYYFTPFYVVWFKGLKRFLNRKG